MNRFERSCDKVAHTQLRNPTLAVWLQMQCCTFSTSLPLFTARKRLRFPPRLPTALRLALKVAPSDTGTGPGLVLPI